ncbi:MAG: polyprenyl synthetase family protein [Muribaculaceae bacterium]|nr:polyprenyl synthetase family protein [Muribaculaceae bacterium]
MTSIQDIRHRLAPRLEELNDLIAAELMSGNVLMNNVISGYLEHRGKQLRPIIVMLVAEMLGHSGPNVTDAAASVEILHNASLIHDDVVDNSDTRHGHDTINAIWANHIAVLVGDFFVSTSLRLALRTGDMRVIGVIASLGRLLSVGEMDQIYNAREHTLTEDAYFEVISHKTASLFEACVEMGCYCAGVDDDRLRRLREFARLLGLCFQIKDDLFDYSGSDKIGKPTGNDLREGKITLPLIHALSASTHPDRENMLELSRRGSLSDSEIATLIAFAHDAGGLDYALGRLNELHARAIAILDTFPPSEASASLRALADYVIDRDS